MRTGSLATTVALAAVLAVDVAGGAPSASRIVDRTVVCNVAGTGSPDVVRVMTIVGWDADRANKRAPTIRVEAAGEQDAVTAGANTGPFWPDTVGLAWLSRLHCKPTQVRIPLTAKGLRAVPGYGSYRCDVPARVFVRLRAEFRRPVTLARDPKRPWRLVAKGRIDRAAVAVATLSGRRPLMLATANDGTGTGRAVAAASRCDPHGA